MRKVLVPNTGIVGLLTPGFCMEGGTTREFYVYLGSQLGGRRFSPEELATALLKAVDEYSQREGLTAGGKNWLLSGFRNWLQIILSYGKTSRKARKNALLTADVLRNNMLSGSLES